MWARAPRVDRGQMPISLALLTWLPFLGVPPQRSIRLSCCLLSVPNQKRLWNNHFHPPILPPWGTPPITNSDLHYSRDLLSAHRMSVMSSGASGWPSLTFRWRASIAHWSNGQGHGQKIGSYQGRYSSYEGRYPDSEGWSRDHQALPVNSRKRLLKTKWGLIARQDDRREGMFHSFPP